MANRQRRKPFALLEFKNSIIADHEPSGNAFGPERRSDRVEIPFAARMEDMEVDPEGACRRPHVEGDRVSVLGLVASARTAMTFALGTSLAQQFQPLRHQLRHSAFVAAGQVAALPGAKFATWPVLTWPLAVVNTIEIVVVAAFAASAAGPLAKIIMTSDEQSARRPMPATDHIDDPPSDIRSSFTFRPSTNPFSASPPAERHAVRAEVVVTKPRPGAETSDHRQRRLLARAVEHPRRAVTPPRRRGSVISRAALLDRNCIQSPAARTAA